MGDHRHNADETQDHTCWNKKLAIPETWEFTEVCVIKCDMTWQMRHDMTQTSNFRIERIMEADYLRSQLVKTCFAIKKCNKRKKHAFILLPEIHKFALLFYCPPGTKRQNSYLRCRQPSTQNLAGDASRSAHPPFHIAGQIHFIFMIISTISDVNDI